MEWKGLTANEIRVEILQNAKQETINLCKLKETINTEKFIFQKHIWGYYYYVDTLASKIILYEHILQSIKDNGVFEIDSLHFTISKDTYKINIDPLTAYDTIRLMKNLGFIINEKMIEYIDINRNDEYILYTISL